MYDLFTNHAQLIFFLVLFIFLYIKVNLIFQVLVQCIFKNKIKNPCAISLYLLTKGCYLRTWSLNAAYSKWKGIYLNVLLGNNLNEFSRYFFTQINLFKLHAKKVLFIIYDSRTKMVIIFFYFYICIHMYYKFFFVVW